MGVESAWSHHIESDVALFCHFVTVFHAKIMGCAGSYSREIVLPCATTLLGNVVAGGVSRCVMNLGLLLLYEFLYIF